MSRIPLVDEPVETHGEQIFAEIEDQLGTVPNMLRVYAHNPPLLAAIWGMFRTLMVEGKLSRKLREAIALVVSAGNRSDYGIARYCETMEEHGGDPELILKLRLDPDHAALNPKEHALLELAHHGNIAPHDHGERLLDAARQAGATDEEILEALGLMQLFTGLNRVTDVLAIPND